VGDSSRRLTQKAALVQAATAALEPLAGLFVELGVSSPEAESLLRSVMVHGVHRRELTEGKRANLSRIALLTGVHRNDVKRILECPPGIDADREATRHRANRVLAGWHDDPDYQGKGDAPCVLTVQGRRPSFWGLAERYAPHVYPGLILDELVRVGVVKRLPQERLAVKARVYRETDVTISQIKDLGQRARDLLDTLSYNLRNADRTRPCETALSLDVDEQWLPVLRNTWRKRMEAFIQSVSEDINSERVRASSAARRKRIGITVYAFEDSTAQEGKDEAAKAAPRRRRK
jgi:hypothetical protein